MRYGVLPGGRDRVNWELIRAILATIHSNTSRGDEVLRKLPTPRELARFYRAEGLAPAAEPLT